MIYVNARFLTRKLTGVDRFAIEICRQLIRMRPGEFCLVTPHDIVQKDIAAELGAKVIGRSKGYLWEQFTLPRYLHKQGCPLLLNLCSIAPVLYGNNVVTLHDITWVRYPDTFSWKFRFFYNCFVPTICRRARHIFTVSEFSREEIASHFSLDRNRITVLYNAVNDKFIPATSSNGSGNYFLAVSSAKANKNFGAIIKAYGIYDSGKSNCRLLIIGDMESKVFRRIGLKQMSGNPRIKLLGRVSDAELVDYYRGAAAFIFPSFYEGFGLPALEAQACGAPVISSNTSSLPEVLGDSALFCSPDSPDAIAGAMKALSEDDGMRQDLIRRGFRNVKRYSWAASAKKCLEILSSL